MKKLLLITIAIFSLGLFTANAQNNLKFAHYSESKVIDSLPSYIKAKEELNKQQTEMILVLEQLNKELQDKYVNYERAKDTLSDFAREYQEQQIQELSMKIQQNNQDFELKLERLNNKLMQPIVENLDKAIKIVAERHKLNYVFEKSLFSYVNGGLDLTEEIRAELIKLEEARTSGTGN